MRSINLHDKKGDLTGVLFFVVSIAAFGIFLLIVGYIGKTVGNEMKDQINASGYDEEIDSAFQATINVSTHTLPSLWYIMFGGLLIGLMITAWMIPTHPIFAVPFIILLIIAIIVGVAMSNAYEEIAAVGDFGVTAEEQGAVGWLMTKLPYIALIVGLITLIVSYAKPGQGGGFGAGASPTM